MSQPEAQRHARSHGRLGVLLREHHRHQRYKATFARDAASSVGKWILVGGAGFLGWKALDFLAARERARLQRAASSERRALNSALERVADRRSKR